MLRIRKNRSLVALLDAQFLTAIVIGWIACSILWKNKDGLSKTESESAKCLTCVDKVCQICDQDADNQGQDMFENTFYRDYLWKPQNAVEDQNNYWRISSRKHRVGMANEEPQVGINGMWRLERDEIVSYLKDSATNSEDDSPVVGFTYKQMLRKYDPFYGVSYIVNADTQSKSLPGGETTVATEYEIRRKFRSGKPSLINIKLANDSEIVYVITPLSKVSERFHKFLRRLEKTMYSTDEYVYAKLIFVIFGDSKSEDAVTTVSALNKFQQRNPKANMQYKFVDGEFNRAIGLDTGVKMCPDDALMLFLDVDLSISPQFLSRTRSNTVQHEKVVFPIMFSQFDPDIIDNYRKTLWESTEIEDAGSLIGEDKGFWIYYAFGVASMYKSDYLSVGGFPLDIVGWGGEDVNIFKKFIASNAHEVMSTVDPDLVHIYHQRSCDVNLAPDQYRMCIGALSETIGSEIQIGTLYLKHKEDEYFSQEH